jgi:predicted DNA-binding protein (UPF0251 family)
MKNYKVPRTRRLRKIVAPPKFKGYKPYGCAEDCKGYIELLYEEYEAIKLADFDLMKHQEACILMGVSRPTFARIYESARRKIASALVETKEIKAIYGNAYLDRNWFICDKCNARFTIPKVLAGKKCPVCKSLKIKPIKK